MILFMPITLSTLKELINNLVSLNRNGVCGRVARVGALEYFVCVSLVGTMFVGVCGWVGIN